MTEYDFSEGFKRLSDAAGGTSDGIPFCAQMHEFSMRHMAVSARQFYSEPGLLVGGLLKTAADFGFDAPDLMWDVYNIEAEALGQKVVFFDDRAPACDNSDPLIKTEADLARLEAPDPHSSGRMPFAFESLRLFKDLTGETPGAPICAPLTLAAQLVGFEKLVYFIYRKPDFVRRILAFITEEVLAPYIEAVLEEFPDAPSADLSDAVASPPFLTVEMMEEFSIPYILRLRELCGDKVIVQNWWGDSRVDDLEKFLDLKLKVCPNLLKCQDPDLAKVGAERVKAFADANDVALVFGVSNNLLNDGPVEAIEERIKHYMEVGGGNGRFILYLCNLSAGTPPEHVRAAVAAIKKYRYADKGGRRP